MASFSTAIDSLHPDVLSRALRCMDGPTLAAVGCSTSMLRSLSAEPSLWRDLCLDAWPSLRLLPIFPLLSPRSFFADSYPFPATDPEAPAKLPLPERVFSAVDVRYAGAPVLSRVVETDASCAWFLGSVFRIDALERKSLPAAGPWRPPAAEADASPAGLELSWTVIDAATRRAVNVSSRSPVAVDRHWYTGEALVRFVTVLGGCAVSVVVTCGEEAGQVREVSMTVEDEDGIAMDGRKGLGILTAALMNGRRRRRGRGNGEETEAKRRYEEYLRRKEARKERMVRREGLLDLCCTGFATLLFVAFLLLVAFK